MVLLQGTSVNKTQDGRRLLKTLNWYLRGYWNYTELILNKILGFLYQNLLWGWFEKKRASLQGLAWFVAGSLLYGWLDVSFCPSAQVFLTSGLSDDLTAGA